jgi:hypothetical protein
MKTFGKAEYLIAVLRDVAEGGKYREHLDGWDGGVCGIIEEVTQQHLEHWDIDLALDKMMQDAAADYDEFSGNYAYPIPPPAEFSAYGHCNAYRAYYDLPRWIGESGESRRDYAAHVANYIEENYT